MPTGAREVVVTWREMANVALVWAATIILGLATAIWLVAVLEGM